MRVSKRIVAIVGWIVLIGCRPVSAAESDAVAELQRMVDHGYLDAYVAEIADGVRIVRGERYHIQSMYVNDSLYEDQIDRVASQENIKSTVARLVEAARSEGYYFVRARLDSMRKVESGVVLHISESRGPTVALGRVLIEGLQRSDESRVRRLLGSTDSLVVSPETIDMLARRAEAIDYLSFVPPIELRVRPGYTEADLAVTFQEKPQVRVAGGGGYSPEDDIGLVWHLDLALSNLFGGGRTVGVRSARPDRGRSLLDINYSQPLFLVGADRLSFAVATRNYEDSFYEFGVSGEFRSRLSPVFALSVRPGWRRVEPEGEASGYSAYRIGLGAERTTLDQSLNPFSGYRLETAIDYVYRRYSKDSLATDSEPTSFNETRTTFRFDGYQPLIGNLVGRVAVSYEGFESEQELPPLSELILIGGPGSIRGYRTEQFAVRRTAYGSIEPRYRFANGNVFTFFDGAYINRTLASESGTATDERFEWSVGFGLNLTQGSRGLSVSFGWAKDAAFDEPRLAIALRSDI